mmetsp:Transcript_86262/g.175233  ORF Transcript_86262/g.175233 Transcript_86262/m.175233 type:complete len:260 (+) Transcript_86262:310-1089(+)
MICEDCVHRLREQAVVHWEGDAVRRVIVLGLRREDAPIPIDVASQSLLHHLLDGAVDIASLIKLAVVPTVGGVLATEDGDKPLVRVPERTEDRLVAEIALRELLWPVLLRRVKHRTSGDIGLHLQVRISMTPNLTTWLLVEIRLRPRRLPCDRVAKPANRHHVRGILHIPAKRCLGDESDRLNRVPEVKRHMHEHQVSFSTGQMPKGRHLKGCSTSERNQDKGSETQMAHHLYRWEQQWLLKGVSLSQSRALKEGLPSS